MSQSEKNQTKKWYEPILDWLKLNGGTYLANLIMTYGGTYIKTAIGGIPGTLAVVIFKYMVVPFLKNFKKDLIIDAESKKKLQEFVTAIRKEGVTHEEFTAAEDNFFDRP